MRKLRLISTVIAVAVTATIGFASLTNAGTFPGHNGLIAFAADTGTGYQLYTVHPNGHNLKRITHLSGDAVYPDRSPNGRRVVFELDRPTRCQVVELMNANGSGLIGLTKDKNVCEATPSFTPDGSHIVFERNDPSTNVDAIWMMTLAGGQRHEITAGTGAGVTDPEVSPDGKIVSFVDFNGTDAGAALYTTHINGSHLRQLLPFKFDVAVKQEWAPNGKNIVFSYDAYHPLPGLSPNIATIRPNGTGFRSLTHYTDTQVGGFVGSYSPDGRWIVFRREDHGKYALYRMNPDSGALRAILPLSSFKPRYIDWGGVYEHRG